VQPAASCRIVQALYRWEQWVCQRCTVPMPHCHHHHHHQITKLSHSINAIGPAPHQGGRKREHRSIMFATITHIPSLHKIRRNAPRYHPTTPLANPNIIRNKTQQHCDRIERVISLLSASPVGEARCRCRKVWLTRIDYYYYCDRFWWWCICLARMQVSFMTYGQERAPTFVVVRWCCPCCMRMRRARRRSWQPHFMRSAIRQWALLHPGLATLLIVGRMLMDSSGLYRIRCAWQLQA
jgi:hypothetical protein